MTPAMDADSGEIPLRATLKAVSRSFYLSIRFLPAASRRPVAIAYLLARAADSVADTPRIPVAERRECLRRLRDLYEEGASTAGIAFPPANVIEGQELAGERELLTGLSQCLGAYAALDPGDREIVRDVLRTLTGGMMDDLTRFPDAAAGPVALESRAELDRYCYSVAGVVGEFWSRIHVRRLTSMAQAPLDQLVSEGVRFGNGLQMINVLRDLPRDLRRGRCYLPLEDLRPLGLSAAELLAPSAMSRLRPFVDQLIALAFDHLRSGLRYIYALPAEERALRRSCWMPLAIGVRTLGGIRHAENLLDPASRVKVPRLAVLSMLAGSFIFGPTDRYVARRFAVLARAAGFPVDS